MNFPYIPISYIDVFSFPTKIPRIAFQAWWWPLRTASPCRIWMPWSGHVEDSGCKFLWLLHGLTIKNRGIIDGDISLINDG